MTVLYDGNNVMRRSMERQIMPGSEIMSLRGRFEAAFHNPNDIWVWDGYRHNERRREVYPQYKLNRTAPAENIFAQIKLWKDILKTTPSTQIEVSGWEADDVIGTLVRKQPNTFTVHTNDMDYGQIEHLCTLKGVDLKGVEPRWIALYKALNGDKSDNIDGIPGFGPKRWLEMKNHWEEIERSIVRGDPEGFIGLPFKPKVKSWLTSSTNLKLLQSMLTVTHFDNVPDDELEGGIIEGQPDYLKGHQMLSEFFL